jgi:ABC-type nitrate/sulfonate/bicarbonate transport system permease component
LVVDTTADEPRSTLAVSGHTETTPSGSSRLLDALRATGIGLVVPSLFVLIWWLTVVAGVFPESVLPSPVTVVKSLWIWAFGNKEDHGLYAGTLSLAIMASGARVIVGYTIAAVLGIAIGVPTGASRVIGQLIDPFIQLMRPIPITAWVPLSLIFFGFDFKNAVFLVALGSFFPIVVNTIEGVRGVNRNLVKVGRMVGARKLKLLWFFILPASLPSVFVGLRLGIGLAWVLVIVAELLSVKNGIGYTLLDAYSFNRFDVVIAAMIMLGVMGFLSDRIILGIQKIFLRWHHEVSIHAE